MPNPNKPTIAILGRFDDTVEFAAHDDEFDDSPKGDPRARRTERSGAESDARGDADAPPVHLAPQYNPHHYRQAELRRRHQPDHQHITLDQLQRQPIPAAQAQPEDESDRVATHSHISGKTKHLLIYLFITANLFCNKNYTRKKLVFKVR